MGYRSEVIIAVKKQIFDQKGFHLKKDLKDCDVITLVGDHFDNIDPARDDNRFYVFCWESVKWYDTYPEVSDMMSFLGSLDEEDYGFVRIGEDSDDVVEQGCPYEFEISVKVIVETPDGKDIKEDFFKANTIKFIDSITKKPRKKKPIPSPAKKKS